MQKEARYFNFPIQLIKGFVEDKDQCLLNISCYAIYSHALKLWEKNPNGIFPNKIEAARKYFRVEFDEKYDVHNLNNQYSQLGSSLYKKYGKNNPMVGLNLDIFISYKNNHKSEFEIICLLGFVAIKSILQNKAYCKITNQYWISRMDGQTHSVNQESISNSIAKYYNEYQTKKIKKELSRNWNLKTYARYTRGFYVSFNLKFDDLVYQAEKRRKSTLEKSEKFEKKLGLEKALRRLEIESGQ